MPKKSNKQAHATGHPRIRRDHATETAEDYVEAILDIIEANEVCRSRDLANKFQVTHVTVNKTIKRLKRDGLVQSEPYQPIQLTAKGKKMAVASRGRHEIVLEFLLALGVSLTTANTDSEGIEHHVSDETLKAMQSFTRKSNKSG